MVVENHKLPVAYSLSLDNMPYAEGVTLPVNL
jgi:hypothetical protein